MGDERAGSTRPLRISSERGAHVGGARRVRGADVDLAAVQREAVEVERLAGIRRRVEAQHAARARPRRTRRRRASGAGVQTSATSTSSLPCRSAPSAIARSRRSRAARGPRRRRPRAHARRRREQAARCPAPTTSRLSPARSPARSKRAQHAGQRLDEAWRARRRGRSRPAAPTASSAGTRMRSAKPPGSIALTRGRPRRASRARAGSAGTRRTGRDGGRRRGRRPAHDVDPGADRDDLADELVAEDDGHLRRDPGLADVRAADAARQQPADDLARPGPGSGRSSTRTLSGSPTARPSCEQLPRSSRPSAARATPRSVTSAVIERRPASRRRPGCARACPAA